VVEGDKVVGVGFTDLLTGATHTATASVVVNAAGPWVDEVLACLDGRSLPRMLGGTKGTHLVVEPFPGAPNDAMYYQAVADGRPMMVIPWLGRYLIGSTDERFAGDLDTVSTDDEEIEYVLRETNQILPGASLRPDDILWCYEGVRPLPFRSEGPTSDISRRHQVHDHAPQIDGLLSIVGGKLTTFRLLGQDVTDAVLRKLRTKGRRSVTRRLRLPGAGTADFAGFSRAFVTRSPLPQRAAGRLLRIYGTRAVGVVALAATDDRLARVVDEETGAIAAEVVFAIREEMASTLGDVVARRIMTGLSADLGVKSLAAVARVVEEHAGWPADRLKRDVEAYQRYITKFRGHVTVSG
jgi:glycerol-3-phosphate dehydrogenase